VPAIAPRLETKNTKNPLSGSPRLTEWHYHFKGSHYVTVGLLG